MWSISLKLTAVGGKDRRGCGGYVGDVAVDLTDDAGGGGGTTPISNFDPVLFLSRGGGVAACPEGNSCG